MITIPTLQELYTSILNDLETEFGHNVPAFGKNYLRAQAAVQAAKIKLIYYLTGGLQKNIFADTADPEASGGTLERFGRVKLGRNPYPAEAGQYTVSVTGSAGATIPASTTFKSNDDSASPQKLFVLDIEYTLTGSGDTMTLRALEAGSDSKLEIGDQLTSTSPIPNVNKIVTVTAESVTPINAETTEEYRRKTVEAYQLEPQGGAASDYRIWAQDVPGITRVYPYAKPGESGVVDVYAEATVADSTDNKGTPSASMLEDLEDVFEMDPDITQPLNDRGRRPLGVFDLNVLPITVREIDIFIDGFEGLTPAKEAAIENALTSELAKVRPFVAGADVLENKNDIFDVNRIVSIILAVSPGSIFGTVTMEVDGVEEPTHTFINGDIPHLNSVTFT
jgi:uncharacterized phage protein gp47/JayE